VGIQINVTLRQLRAFVEVVHSGGFSAAAPKLHLTQSATSLLVRELESQLNLSLIDRSTRRLSLTEAGREFLVSAQRIVSDVEQSVADTQELLHKRRGRVTIATTPFLAASLLPRCIAQFRERYSAITVKLADLPVEQIVRRVLSGDADLGVGVFPELDSQISRFPLLRHCMGAMVPSTYELGAGRRDLTWEDLHNQPFISMSHDSGIRTLIDRSLHDAGVRVDQRFEVSYLGTAIGLSEAGLGITVMPAYVGMLMRSNNVRFLPLRNPVVQRQVDLIFRAGSSLSPSGEAFLQSLVAICEALEG
jgi:DNA-binding transcriptional LysR family regulator